MPVPFPDCGVEVGAWRAGFELSRKAGVDRGDRHVHRDEIASVTQPGEEIGSRHEV
jgi:hypothetical protein